MRLDRWLWAIRVFKTRTCAATAIKAGRVRFHGEPVKPSREVRTGEILTAEVGPMTRTFKVLAAPPSRVGAKLVSGFVEELTPAEEFEKQRDARSNHAGIGYRARGTGRPTKREGREVAEFSDRESREQTPDFSER